MAIDWEIGAFQKTGKFLCQTNAKGSQKVTEELTWAFKNSVVGYGIF
jgi:hypothetical protein